MKNISTLERMSVKNEKNATILELPNEIDLSDFLDQSKYRDHFNKDEINKLNLLTGDLKGIEFGEPSKTFTHYDFSQSYGSFGRERIYFKGYLLKRRNIGGYLVHSGIRYILGDIDEYKPIFFYFDSLEQFCDMYKNLPKIVKISVEHRAKNESKILSFKNYTNQK